MEEVPVQLKPYRIAVGVICVLVILAALFKLSTATPSSTLQRQPTHAVDVRGTLATAGLQVERVDLQGNIRLVAYDPARLQQTQYVLLYFSAGWCGPCHQFTPGLVTWYNATKPMMPDIELVFCSFDKDREGMEAYAREYVMPWPVMTPESVRSHPLISRYAGDGIPCLVLVDRNGKIVADSYADSGYVGPHVVVEHVNQMIEARLNLAKAD